MLSSDEQDPGQRIDAHRVWAGSADVANGKGGAARVEQFCHAVGQPWKVRTRDRAPDNDADRGLLVHRLELRRRRALEVIAARPMNIPARSRQTGMEPNSHAL